MTLEPLSIVLKILKNDDFDLLSNWDFWGSLSLPHHGTGGGVGSPTHHTPPVAIEIPLKKNKSVHSWKLFKKKKTGLSV